MTTSCLTFSLRAIISGWYKRPTPERPQAGSIPAPVANFYSNCIMQKTISISIPDGLDISNISDKVWQVLYAHDELISPEERVFVVGILNKLEGTASDD
jgi:hypothetical protein